MEDSSLIHVTKSGRQSRKVVANYCERPTRKSKENNATMATTPDESQKTQMVAQKELDRQRAELEELRERLSTERAEFEQAKAVSAETQEQDATLREQLRLQSAELQRYKELYNPQTQSTMSDLNAGPRPQTALDSGAPRDYTADMCAILGNVHTMELEVKPPSFADENLKNPLEFLSDVERFCTIKNIKEQNKLSILNVMLEGKARTWYELQNSFSNYAEFSQAFLNSFYTIPIQVKIKSQWSTKKFIDQENNLQTFLYRQLKEANFLRRKMTAYETNYTIVQQLPQSIRRALVAINFEDSDVIGQTLANLDSIYAEKPRNFERKPFEPRNNVNTPDSAQVNQVNVKDTESNTYNNRGPGRSRGNRRNNNYRGN